MATSGLAQRLSGPTGVVALAAVGAVVVHLRPPVAGAYPPCPLHALTGLWCPLCGGTRMVAALVQGHWATALHDNAFALLVLAPLAAAGLAMWTADAVADRPRRRLLAGGAWWALAGAALVFTVVRNLPVGRALAP